MSVFMDQLFRYTHTKAPDSVQIQTQQAFMSMAGKEHQKESTDRFIHHFLTHQSILFTIKLHKQKHHSLTLPTRQQEQHLKQNQ